MKTLLPITQVVSTKCGGYGAWMDNPLSSPAPGSGSWRGFQMGGSRKRRHKRGYNRRYKKYTHNRNTRKKTKKHIYIN